MSVGIKIADAATVATTSENGFAPRTTTFRPAVALSATANVAIDSQKPRRSNNSPTVRLNEPTHSADVAKKKPYIAATSARLRLREAEA